MKSKPRICVTCGTAYEYCPKCSKDADKPVWMVAFHTEECRKVYNIIARYNTTDLSKEDAKKELSDIVSHKVSFSAPIQEKIDEIMKEETVQAKPTVKRRKIVTEN